MHAVVRWDKRQKSNANDFVGAHHAAAAVGYRDAFFTKRSLINALTRGDLASGELRDRTVVITPEATLEYFQAMDWQPVAH